MFTLNSRCFISFFLVSLSFFPASVYSDAYENWSGKEIIDEATQRHERPFEYEEQIMTLIDSKGNQEVREVRRFSREGPDGLYRYVFVFDAPSGVKGVALLTWQNMNTDDDQWVYLPALGRKLKRQAKGSKRNYFMGTDFANEDLISEDSGKFRYERGPDIRLDNLDHFVIRSFPDEKHIKKSTGYKFKDLFIRKDNFFTTATDYFDRRGMLLKRQETEELDYIEEKMFRSNLATMKRFEGGNRGRVIHQTIVKNVRRSFNESDVPAKVFEQRFVKSGRHTKN